MAQQQSNMQAQQQAAQQKQQGACTHCLLVFVTYCLQVFVIDIHVTYFIQIYSFILWLIVLILKEMPMEKYRVLLKQISNRDPVLILTKETEMLWFNIGQYEMEH